MVGTHIRRLGFVAAMVLIALPLFAQTTGAVLQGTVADEQGGVLPGATITIVNVETGWTRDVVSDERGWYRAAALRRADTKFAPRCQASSPSSAPGWSSRSDRRRRSTSRCGWPPWPKSSPSPPIRRSSKRPATRSNAPLRAPIWIRCRWSAATSPIWRRCRRASPASAAAASARRGQTTRSNSFIIDGTSNDDTVVNTQRGGFSLESVREFAVITNQFNAEYGMASGAIVSVITRSGTNELQGRVFGFHRDDSLRRAGSVLEGARIGQVAVQPAALRRLPRRPDRARSLPLLRLVRAAAGGDHQRRHLVARAGRASAKCRPPTWGISTSSRPTSA